MTKLQTVRMQRKATGKLRAFRAVKKVPSYRTAQGSQMHANLMGPPGFQAKRDQRTSICAVQYPIMGAGWFATGIDAARHR